ncbi:MAG TPA: amino acid adenylation domain-containing protein, partial [Chthoniobacteraceae bacterium]|nr:amino acid adenylation domain-containing protein [Chthoniobacteraceae bacterium]
KALLHRYTQQDDLVVGSYIANRNRAEVESIIGFFVNTVVLRTDLSGAPTFREALHRVRDVALGAYAHQDMPFETLVEQLQPDRDLSRNPIFQVVFQVPPAPTSAQESGGAAASGERLPEVKTASAAFDLSVSIWEMPHGLDANFEYSCDLFNAATIEGMARHLVTLLQSFASEPDQPITGPSLLRAAEKKQLLEEWSQTRRTAWPNESIVELFARQVERMGDAPAFWCGPAPLSFLELDRRSNRLANYLRTLGVAPEVLVGVAVERSLECMVILFAIFKAGGAFLPLDPSYPVARLRFMAEDAQVPLILTSRAGGEIFAGIASVRVVNLEEEWAAIARGSDEYSGPALAPEQLAYVMYTSGSTGRPKGVAVAHRVILNRLHWMWEAYPFAPGETGAQKTALNFVDSLWEILGYSLQGVPAVIVPDAVLEDPAALVQCLGAREVSRLWLVPSLLEVVLDSVPDLAAALPKLKFWVSSGEALGAALFVRFQRLLPEAVLYNLYGTTEVWDATWYDPRDRAPTEGQVPIGRPLTNVEVYVLDENGGPVPAGVPGELHVGGAGLARGYLNRPEATAEKFIPHPFSTEPGARLYRTGDRVRRLPDGNLEYLGRLDQQVKIRGHRIELPEVEAALLAHPAVQAAAVTLREDRPGDPRLVAYIVQDAEHNGDRPSAESLVPELRAFVQQRLPKSSVPSAFVSMARLPLTPSGKLNRRALPAPDDVQRGDDEAFVAPRTPAEEAMAGLWREILGVTAVGVHDHFFSALGGHSLLAAQLISRIRNRLQVELPLRAIFEHPTVSGLAAELETVQKRTADPGPRLVARSRAEYRLRPAGDAAVGPAGPA